MCFKISEAFAALKIAEEKFLCVSKSMILLVKLQLLHERALHRYFMFYSTDYLVNSIKIYSIIGCHFFGSCIMDAKCLVGDT